MRLPSWFIAVILLLIPASVFADDSTTTVDSGRFEVFIGDRRLGSEDFEVRSNSETIKVIASVFYLLPGREGSDSLAKRMTMELGAFDFDLRHYNSTQKFRGATLARGVEPHDTTYSVYRDVDGRGVGDTYSRPPGRMFVLDGQIFTSFVVVCRNLQGRTFDRRPLWLLALSARDTMMQVEITHLGSDTLRWGARAVRTQKYRLADSNTAYLMWATDDGRMLQLEQPESRLRVLRTPPPVKRAKKK